MFSANLYSFVVLAVTWGTVWLQSNNPPSDATSSPSHSSQPLIETPYVPPFLQGEPQSTIDEYNDLIMNLTLRNSSVVGEEFDEWIAGKGPAVQERYKEYNRLWDQQKKAMALYQAEFEKLSLPAKKAELELTRMSSYVNDLQRKISDFYTALPTDVRNELDKLHLNNTLEA